MNRFLWIVTASAFSMPAAADPAQDYDRGYDLAKAKGCFECHAVGYRDVGPSYIAIAARYREYPNARQRLPYAIRGGSAGHWGERFAMWPQPQISDAEMRVLMEWILSH